MIVLVDAWENRDMATSDDGRAYLHADIDNYTLFKLEGLSVGIMCEVNSAYENFLS